MSQFTTKYKNFIINHPKWKQRRKDIIKRDNYTCQDCKSKSNLQVHHKYYNNLYLYWEYSDKFLTTLCKTCHNDLHDVTPISMLYESPYKFTKDINYAVSNKIYNLVKKINKSKIRTWSLVGMYSKKYKTFKRIDCIELSYYIGETPEVIRDWLLSIGLKYRKAK